MFLGLLKRLLGPKLFGPRMLADPYSYYARLRSTDPVHWADQFGGWVLTRYADVTAVLRSPDASSERTAAARQRVGPEFQALYDVRSHAMLNADAPRHTRLRLLVNKAFTPRTVEELLRYDSPVQFTSRILKADMALGGKVLRAGQMVLLLLGAANRDPEQFPDPDRLDVGRPDNKHVAFGLGPHFCLGAPLARLEGRLVFEALLRRAPGLRLDGPPPRYRQNFNLRGLESLNVTL